MIFFLPATTVKGFRVGRFQMRTRWGRNYRAEMGWHALRKARRTPSGSRNCSAAGPCTCAGDTELDITFGSSCCGTEFPKSGYCLFVKFHGCTWKCMIKSWINWILHQCIDWLLDNWLIDWLVDWLIDWFIVKSIMVPVCCAHNLPPRHFFANLAA